MLFHHDTTHSDDELTGLEARAAELWEGVRPPALARERMRLAPSNDAVELAACG